ncbi:MAG: porin, partial [Nevskiales bacterium]
YGVADAYFGQTTTTTKTTATGLETKLKQTVVDSGGINGSRWGLRGSEDLGGGLKANFQFESGFDISTGRSLQGGALFGRQAYVGLSGGFGAVTLGRQYTAYDALRGDTNNTYDSAFATTGTAWNTGVVDYTSRVNNSIAYKSPDFGGFSGSAVVALGEDKTPTASASRNTSLQPRYANGPILAGYAHQTEKSVGGVPSNRKYNLIAGSYDLGVASITGGYNIAKQGPTEDKEYQLGVKVPFGAASVAAGYSRAKTETAGVTSKGTGYSIAGLYDLSKRTALYAAWNQTKADFAAFVAPATSATVKTSVVAVGIRHRF